MLYLRCNLQCTSERTLLHKWMRCSADLLVWTVYKLLVAHRCFRMADNVNSGITKKRSIGTMAPSSDMASDALRLGFQVSDQDAQTFLQQYPLDTIQQ